MDQLICANRNCGASVRMDDQFCGICGTPVARQPMPGSPIGNTAPFDSTHGTPSANGEPTDGGKTPSPPTGGVAGSPSTTSPDEPEGQPFFSHEPAHQSGPLSTATLSLCAAAYLDYGFANKVILELLMTHRAVAPSVNFDIGPVLRHCLRARRHILLRDILLIVIILAGLVIRPLPTLDVLLFTFVLGGVLPRVNHHQSRFWARLLLILAAVVIGGLAVVFTIFLIVGSFVSAVFSGEISTTLVTGPAALVGTFVILVGALAATEFVYLLTTTRALLTDSQQEVQSHRNLSRATERRMAVIEGAQWGNITLHSGWFPFIGTGDQTQAHWSIATQLRTRAASDKDRGDDPGEIDPVHLQQAIRRRLCTLNDPGQPENKRIAALTVSDRLVGTGWLSVGNPLLDSQLKTPYSHASEEAVDALIRHPQASLRYYQQVSVNDKSPVVTSGGRTVINEMDQEVAVSAFVYAAMEGGMLYLQFVLTALPPIDDMYRIDRTGFVTSTSRVLLFTFQRLFSSVVTAVPGLYGAFRLWRRERQSEKRYGSRARANYGAQISVRELGTATDFNRYIQVLDVEKYNMIISQVLLNAVTDYLAERGIDTSAFTGIAQNIINNINNGTVYGNLNQQAGQNNSVNNPPNPGSGS